LFRGLELGVPLALTRSSAAGRVRAFVRPAADEFGVWLLGSGSLTVYQLFWRYCSLSSRDYQLLLELVAAAYVDVLVILQLAEQCRIDAERVPHEVGHAEIRVCC
jgi:hypothetical protein